MQFGTTTSGVANFKLFHYTTLRWVIQIYRVCKPMEAHTQNTMYLLTYSNTVSMSVIYIFFVILILIYLDDRQADQSF